MYARKNRRNFLTYDYFNYKGIRGEVVTDRSCTETVSKQFIATDYAEEAYLYYTQALNMRYIVEDKEHGPLNE